MHCKLHANGSCNWNRIRLSCRVRRRCASVMFVYDVVVRSWSRMLWEVVWVWVASWAQTGGLLCCTQTREGRAHLHTMRCNKTCIFNLCACRAPSKIERRRVLCAQSSERRVYAYFTSTMKNNQSRYTRTLRKLWLWTRRSTHKQWRQTTLRVSVYVSASAPIKTFALEKLGACRQCLFLVCPLSLMFRSN